MAVLFLLLAFLVVVVLAVAGLENTSASSATLFNRSFGDLTEGQLLILAAALGFLVALFLFLAFGASRTRRSRRKELKSRRRDAEGRVDELERENARLNKDLAEAREQLDATERNRSDAVAERDRAEATTDRIRATRSDDRQADATAPAGAHTADLASADPGAADMGSADTRTAATAPADARTGAPLDDRARPAAGPPQPESVTRERLDDRTGAPIAREEHTRAADEHARAADEHARAAEEEARRR
jgi:F0F1-type ATP synthase membrane subunit b/b'